MKLWEAKKIEGKQGKAGEVVEIVKKGFVVSAGDGCLLVTEVQAKGGKRMAADAYLRGHSIEVGSILA